MYSEWLNHTSACSKRDNLFRKKVTQTCVGSCWTSMIFLKQLKKNVNFWRKKVFRRYITNKNDFRRIGINGMFNLYLLDEVEKQTYLIDY